LCKHWVLQEIKSKIDHLLKTLSLFVDFSKNFNVFNLKILNLFSKVYFQSFNYSK
jgi:hypothetical protein